MSCSSIPALPETNAQLRAVRPAPSGDSYRGPAGAAAATWTGDVGVWVEESSELRATKDDVERLEPCWLALQTADAIPVDLGDHVTYRRGDGTDVTRRVRIVDRLEAVGLVHLTFWDA